MQRKPPVITETTYYLLNTPFSGEADHNQIFDFSCQFDGFLHVYMAYSSKTVCLLMPIAA